MRVEFAARNTSGRPWRTAGYQVFDPETGNVILDGPRTPIDVPPGARVNLTLDITLPEEPGRYLVFVSALEENVCWYYERGAPFLAIDAVVDGGAARVLRSRVLTWNRWRFERALRSFLRAFALPVHTIARNRNLIRGMVRRDVLARYRGSLGGAAWTILNPLLLMLTYFFVFGVVLQARFGGDPSPAGFALYFLAGMLPWLAFSEALGRAPSLLLEHRNFVKKLVFAIETLPVNVVVSGLVSEFFALALFALALLALRGGIPWTVVWLPALLIPQVLLTAGLCWFLAALGAFVRDLGQIIGFALTLWFFLTPICYPEASLPDAAVPLLAKNPMFTLVRGYRDILLHGQAPAAAPLLKLWALSAAVFLAGHAWFYKLRKSFADIL